MMNVHTVHIDLWWGGGGFPRILLTNIFLYNFFTWIWLPLPRVIFKVPSS